MPFGDVVCGGHAQYSVLAPALQKSQLCFLSLCTLSIISPAGKHGYFQSLIVSLYFVAQGDGASAAAKSPRSQVPACLTGINTCRALLVITQMQQYQFTLESFGLKHSGSTVSLGGNRNPRLSLCTGQGSFSSYGYMCEY